MEIMKKVFIGICLLIPTLLYAEMVDINKADKETLIAEIKGVGDKLSDSIIKYREENGPFNSVADLANVRGLGQAVIDKNIDKLTVETTATVIESPPTTE